LTADVIPPGGEGEIKVTLHPKPTQLTIDKQVVVQSNDPEQPNFSLTMRGSLLVDMSATPSNVVLREIELGKPATTTFTLSPTAGSAARVQSVTLEDTEQFSLRKLDSQPDGTESWEVGFRGSATPTNVSTRITVTTDGENTPTIVIPVNASVVSNLRFVDKIRFSHDKDGVLQERVFRISSRHGDDPPKIKKIEDPDGWLEIEMLEPQGPMANIRMVVKPDKLEGLTPAERTVAHHLFIYTNDKQMPKLDIEYRVAPLPRMKVDGGLPAPKSPAPVKQ
jgi:hypothetical protein